MVELTGQGQRLVREASDVISQGDATLLTQWLSLGHVTSSDESVSNKKMTTTLPKLNTKGIIKVKEQRRIEYRYNPKILPTFILGNHI